MGRLGSNPFLSGSFKGPGATVRSARTGFHTPTRHGTRKERRLDLESRAGWAPDEWTSLGRGQDGIRFLVLKELMRAFQRFQLLADRVLNASKPTPRTLPSFLCFLLLPANDVRGFKTRQNSLLAFVAFGDSINIMFSTVGMENEQQIPSLKIKIFPILCILLASANQSTT
ncbi:Uncharacterized protein HZ326_14964 [Fusarium oxysporum f. sp. albedinis]|nr:Uncharacterized protein HZ326_14964 [Fusarium oxysporum f. sp. albedinis]